MNKMYDMSIGKQSVVDSDVDGLLNWAKGLPDDVSQGGDMSFQMNASAMKFLQSA